MSLQDLKNRYQRKTGERDKIKNQIEACQRELEKVKKRSNRAERGKDIVREVAYETQSQLEYKITSTVTQALQAVFDDPYDFQIDFELRRGKAECDLLFIKNNEQIPPLEASGYGAVDIAAFALRVACWSMSRAIRPVLILDEPFKHLKDPEPNRRVIQMIKEISDRLGIQIIMVSDERASKEDIAEQADKIFKVEQKNGVSWVTKE